MKFEVEVSVLGHILRVTGSASPYVPATGPTMESAGGDPAEGGEIEDIEAWMLHRRKNGVYAKRKLTDAMVEYLENTTDLLSEVEGRVSEDAEDAKADRAEAMADARRDDFMAGDR